MNYTFKIRICVRKRVEVGRNRVDLYFFYLKNTVYKYVEFSYHTGRIHPDRTEYSFCICVFLSISSIRCHHHRGRLSQLNLTKERVLFNPAKRRKRRNIFHSRLDILRRFTISWSATDYHVIHCIVLQDLHSWLQWLLFCDTYITCGFLANDCFLYILRLECA